MVFTGDISSPAPRFASPKIVITGFNTDVEFNGVVYHVQTEDKGLETPFLLTLLYRGGTILARKTQTYDDLIAKGFDEKELEVRLNRQHGLICAAVKSGRIDDLIELSKRDVKIERKKRPTPESHIPNPGESGDLPAPIPKPPREVAIPAAFGEDEPVVDVISIIEDDLVVPTEAVEIISDMAGRERISHNRLCVEFINETPFKGGEQKTITFMVCRGTERKVVGNAQILVKILGSNLRPQIFHSVTDQNGLAKMELELPHFSTGRAAFLVRASSAGEEIEIRRSISST